MEILWQMNDQKEYDPYNRHCRRMQVDPEDLEGMTVLEAFDWIIEGVNIEIQNIGWSFCNDGSIKELLKNMGLEDDR